MGDVSSHADILPWKPIPTSIPREWAALLKVSMPQNPQTPHIEGFDIKHDPQLVGERLRDWGLPLHIVLAGYLWNCDQDQLRIEARNISGNEQVINHINNIIQYLTHIEDENLALLLTPPYTDIGALLAAVAIYYQALLSLQKQSNNQVYTGDVQAYIEQTGKVLLHIATRLGIWSFKYQLEDVIEQLTRPEKFAEAQRERERILARESPDSMMLESIRQLFMATYEDATQQHAIIFYESCGVAGMTRRLQDAHTTAPSSKSSVQDLTGFDIVVYNVIVPTVQDCYTTLGILAQLGYIQDRIMDTIANPKPNGCSQLAFGLIIKAGGPRTHGLSWLETQARVCQIQIKTQIMHAVGWYGAIYPQYYDHCQQRNATEKATFLTGQSLQRSNEGKTFSAIKEYMSIESTQFIAKNSIIVYDSRYNPFVLINEATALDFAYALDPLLGNHAIEALINSRKAPLYRTLNAGDIVEIRTSDEVQTQDHWLYNHHIKTHNARQHIRESLNQRAPEKRIYTLLRHELEQHSFMLTPKELQHELERLVAYHHLGTVQDYIKRLDEQLEAPYTIIWAVQEIMQQVTERNETTAKLQGTSSWTPVLETVTSPLKRLYRRQRLCDSCLPIYPHDTHIIGFIRERNRELIVHKEGCFHLNEDMAHAKSSLLPMKWAERYFAYRVTFFIKAYDRRGLVLDIAKLLQRHTCNFTFIEAQAFNDLKEASARVTIETLTEDEALDIWQELEHVENVIIADIDATTTSNTVRTQLRQLRAKRHNTGKGTSPEPSWEDLSEELAPRTVYLINPFDISRPAPPKMFFGRTSETKAMQRELCDGDHGRALILYGPRRSGKTSICRNFLDTQLHAPFLGVYISLQRATLSHESDMFRRIANEISRCFQKQFGCPAPAWEHYCDSDPQLCFSYLLQDCIDRIPRIRIVLVLDEFGGALEAYEKNILHYRFFTYWKELMNEQSHISLIFALPSSSRTLLTEKFSHVFGFADSLPVTFLNMESAERLLSEPLRNLNIFIQAQAVAYAAQITGGNPYYMTLIGQRLISLLNRQKDKQLITDEDLHFVIEQLVEEGLNQNFIFLRSELQDAEELRILHAITELTSKRSDKPRVQLKKIANWLSTPVHVTRQHLDRLRVGLILEEHEPSSNPYYSFRIELVRRWLLRNRWFFKQ